MRIGLYDYDNPIIENAKFPNLALMKISAYHKLHGDDVEWAKEKGLYDKLYVSKVFGDEYSKHPMPHFIAYEIIYGGTGYAITVEDGKEIYHKCKDPDLPPEIEEIYPDYTLYPHLTEDTAYGFLTRGCCNNCGFCIVTAKEGRCSRKVADLHKFWGGQKFIKLLDPNILACKEHERLLTQLINSGAYVDFTQGLDSRFINNKNVYMLKKIKAKMFHFAFDFMKNEKQILRGLKLFMDVVKPNKRKAYVYVLTNYNTTFEEDFYRVQKLRKIGMDPDIRIYRKPTAPRIIRDLQGWCNNRIIYRTVPDFMDFTPRSDGKSVKELYF